MTQDPVILVTTLIKAMDERQISIVGEALRARHEALHNDRAIESRATLEVGDKVKIHGMRTKYLNGCIGEVLDVDGAKFVQVSVTDGDRRAIQRSGMRGLGIPWSCVTKIDDQLSIA